MTTEIWRARDAKSRQQMSRNLLQTADANAAKFGQSRCSVNG